MPEPSASRTLRRLFLTLFLRGRSARGLEKEKAPKSIGRKLALTLAFYVLFGLIAILLRNQPIFALSAFLHTMTLMFLGMFIASSAGEILFNQEEADILLHRPIEPRALLWAKVGVLAEVSLWLAGAFNLPGLVIGVLSPHGSWRFIPAHALSTALQAFFCTGCVVLVYQLCLRWLGRERLEGIMTTAQVLLSVAAVLSGQLFPYIAEFVEVGDAASKTWWIALLPPAWFAGIDDALAGSSAPRSWALAALGCAATALVLWLAFGKLASDYEAGLQVLNERSRRRAGGRRWINGLVNTPPLRWWLRDPKERATFLLTAAYLVRDRDVKLRVYPALAPFLIFPIVMMARDLSNDGPGAGFGIAFAAGYLSVVPLMAVNLLEFSQDWRAADIFRLAPAAGPAPLCHGARKALLCLLTLPLAIVLLICAWLIKKDFSALALMAPGLIALPLVALIPNLRGRGLPLSCPVEGAKSASRGLMMVATLVATMGLSGVALMASELDFLGALIGAEFLAVSVTYVLLVRIINRMPWPAAE